MSHPVAFDVFDQRLFQDRMVVAVIERRTPGEKVDIFIVLVGCYDGALGGNEFHGEIPRVRPHVGFAAIENACL
jgi:hypothetical protein